MYISAQRIDLAQRAKWNIGFWVAGFIFWAYAAAIGSIYPIMSARSYWLIGACFIGPVAMIASYFLSADPKARGNSLAQLVGMAHVSVLVISLPLIFEAYLYFPDALILVMAICFGIDFFVMCWAYAAPFPAVHAVVRTSLVSLIWFARPEWRSVILPSVVALCYLITVAYIIIERPKWLDTHQ